MNESTRNWIMNAKMKQKFAMDTMMSAEVHAITTAERIAESAPADFKLDLCQYSDANEHLTFYYEEAEDLYYSAYILKNLVKSCYVRLYDEEAGVELTNEFLSMF